MEDLIAFYSQQQHTDGSDSYMIVASDQSHAAIYHCNADGYIFERQYLFNIVDIADIFQTFQKWLSTVSQISHNFDVEENNTPVNAFTPIDWTSMFDEDEDEEAAQ